MDEWVEPREGSESSILVSNLFICCQKKKPRKSREIESAQSDKKSIRGKRKKL